MAGLRLGIVGAGCIGRTVAKSIADSALPYRIAAITDQIEESAAELAQKYAPEAAVVELEPLLESVDVVLESAAAQAVPILVEKARTTWKAAGGPGHIVIMSVGGLLNTDIGFKEGPVLHVPSGAIGALDAVSSMKEAGLDEVVLTTTKPPASLGMDIEQRTVLFEGCAADVVVRYPKNTNVAMAISLAGIGPERTRVVLVADPAVTSNTHHVFARGAAGQIEFKSVNVPFPDNPRTSYLAALSAISVLRSIGLKCRIG